METSAYLERIGYSGSTGPTIETLRKLHRRHMLTVPFENLDIHLGRPIILDPASFYRKIVQERRGGYCYELNGCFAWLLKKLDFKIATLSARLARKNGRFNPEFDHMTLLVDLKQRWLADVGFGDSFTEPILLDNQAPQRDNGRLYQVNKESGNRILSRWEVESHYWKPQYSFTLPPRKLSEFSAMNEFQQTSPQSYFTKGRIISRLTSTGRITLTDRSLILTGRRKRVERPVKNNLEFEKLLTKHFHIRIGN